MFSSSTLVALCSALALGNATLLSNVIHKIATNTGVYDCSTSNPCTPGNAAQGKFYFPNTNPNKYVQCSAYGQCDLRVCPGQLVWDVTANTCNNAAVPASNTNVISDLILRNTNESLTSDFFYRPWTEYQQGFGTLDSRYWIGLDKLHDLSQRGCAVRFDLQSWDGTMYYAKYSTFVVGGSADNYRLNIGGYEGDFGDAMATHNNAQFSTYDYGPVQECGQNLRGGWWFVMDGDAYCCTAWLTLGTSVIDWVTNINTDDGFLLLNAVEVRFVC